ncbi:hypothetical protein [Marinicella rhabdoformis]|uniref:hypothetical protein n=1 Tax=Marinicella rhabdoformis TaxID=2580566 RepID=UPI0012AEC868|nr:hypothetical protein [Marinicella rhabdoformis]
MHHKLIVVLIVIGLLVLWFGFAQNQQKVEPEKPTHVISKPIELQSEVISAPLVVNKNKGDAPKRENVADLIYQEVSQSELNEDPFLAALAIKNRLNQCKQIDFDEKLSKRNDYVKLKPLIIEYEAQCLSWTEQYPVLASNLQQINSIPATSEKGKSLKAANLQRQSGSHKPFNALEGFQQAQSDLVAAQQTGDFEALSVASRGMQSWGVKQRRPEQDILGGQFIYMRQLADVTLRLMACERGSTYECIASSHFMMSTCLEMPKACGLTYPQWADVFLTPGMRMDVEALKAYYSQNM